MLSVDEVIVYDNGEPSQTLSAEVNDASGANVS